MGRARRWTLYIIIGLIALATGIFAARQQFERALVAVTMYRAHVFTPPAPTPGKSRGYRAREELQFYWDFAGFSVARKQRLRKLDPELRPLVQEMKRRQAAGEDMHYSTHIYREIRWLLNFTPDVEQTRAKIESLRQSLDNADAQKLAAEQQPSDGSWGMGIDAWYLRLYYSVDQVKTCRAPARYPLTFLDRINSPEKLAAQLDAALYDRFTETRVFNREELDETFSAIARILFASNPTDCYNFDPQLSDALRAYVGRWQNPATGCWGQWLVDREGRVWKMDDMGITFHVVSDLHGAVDHKDLIAKRLLQLDRVNFPAGILFDGHYENHLNMDAVRIFRLAWPTLDEPTRQQARAEMERMLRWCLTESYQPDGSFRVSDLDDTPGDAYRYGIWFLQETGFFQRSQRFWTDQEFPEAPEVRRRIEAKLLRTGLNDPALREAYETLHTMK